MASVVKNALKAIKEKGLGTFFRELKEEGYTKCLLDGNLFQESPLQELPQGYTRISNCCLKFSNLRPDDLNSKSHGLRQTKIHNLGGKVVGVDKFGNKYYENLNAQYGRHRWVEYAEKGRYNASQVPPEWHGWLHFITDHTGDELLMLKPKRYGLEHKQNFSGEGDEYIYHSKGHALNPGQRSWTRYQPWEPTKA
ncbi:putative NADH dehydrogenase [ubiquinone] 1 alpha subcomplex subunit 12 [Morella rubra]|uniref:NADH dehydrogenase [ubiquinone] 1 alpha subcomplex subunit 12 n=1 Tax=Morella rubra TaxID=262757 RepID=A0A6A1UYS9_9ROSI|nr:putative NADH dehydrogenase [ubiquinone] 1 alpha subcomplex subunit 12 [Morella rubra]